MGLTQLTLQNFKSYQGKLEIPFDGAPFIAVAGPNGTGKSNMLDAICFVVGMKLQNLRSTNSADLVSQGAAEDSMYVSAVVEVDGDPGKKQKYHFKRTTHDFFVDQTSVTEKDYQKLWSQLNIIPHARNCLVLQGDVESFGGADRVSLAKLIEEVHAADLGLDIGQIRNEYAQLVREIDEGSKEARRHTSKRRAAQAEADNNEEFSDAKSRLRELRTEVRKLEKRRKKLVILQKRASLDEIMRKREEAEMQLESCRSEAQLMDTESRRLRSEYAKKRRQLLNARNAEVEAQETVAACEAELKPLERKEEAIEAEIRLVDPDLKFAERLLRNAEQETQSAEEALEIIDRAHQREQELQDSGSSGIPQELRTKWLDLENDFIGETARQQDKYDQLRRQAELAAQKLQAKERKIEDLTSDLAREESRANQRKMRVDQLNQLVEERTSQQTQHIAELSKAADDLSALRSTQNELKAKLKEISENVRASDGNKRALAQRHRLLDAVERLKRAHGDKVHDLLGNLIEPVETRYAIAVEKALGVNADSIVVEDSATAIKCVVQARRERLGTLTFLPLMDLRARDVVPARAQLARQKSHSSETRLLLDCVKYEPRHRSAATYAIGDSVFTPSFLEGLRLRRSGIKMRLIDVKGSVISANNVMSASPGLTSSSTSSDRALAAMQRKAYNLAEKLKTGAVRETELRDLELRINAKCDRAAQTIEAASTELRIARESLKTADSEVKHLKETLCLERSISEELEVVSREAKAGLEKCHEAIAEARKAKFASFLAEAGGSLEVWDSRFVHNTQRFADISKQRRRVDDRLKLALEHREEAATQLAQQKQRLRALETALERVQSHKSRIETSLHSANNRLERAQTRVRTLKDDAEAKSDEVGASETALDNARMKVTEAERKEHRQALALAAEIGEAQAKLDNDESSASDSDEDSISTLQKTLQSRKTTQAHTKRSSTKFDKETLSLDRIDVAIGKLNKEIAPLARLVSVSSSGSQETGGPIDSEKLSDLDCAIEKSRSHLDTLTARFSALKKERAERFIDVVQTLQQTLSSVYTELVGGDGQAKLSPSNIEEPFESLEFMILPPGKQFTQTSQLSGGERSMAALALLFSLQRLFPAPFIVLDEVDAALDFVNVASVSRYIRAHCQEFQFIMVSLKQRLFQSAHNLVGVYKPAAASQILTVAL